MYRVYRLLTDGTGNIVNKLPIACTASLKIAVSFAHQYSGALETGVYKINDDGRETRVL